VRIWRRNRKKREREKEREREKRELTNKYLKGKVLINSF